MTVPRRTFLPRWVLHVHTHLGCAGTLVFDFGGGVVCKVPLTPAQTSLLLALAACRAIDERDGLTVKLGYSTLAELGQVVGTMPGPGNPVLPATIGGYKRAIARRIKIQLDALSLKSGRPLRAPLPILHEGYAQGYCLPEEGLMLVGASIDTLVCAAREVRVPRSHRFPHH